MSPALRYGLFAATCIGGAVVASCYVEPAAPIYGHERDDVACSDGIDNDADYLVDCYDPDCLAESTLCGEIVPEVPIDEPEPNGIGRDAIATCRDRIDNDNDGQFDCGDQECRDIPETCCVIENTNELCSDGIDNDSNGFADCADFGCSQGQFVTVCDDGEEDEDTPLRCSDGLDNDGNQRIDCEEASCSGIAGCPYEYGDVRCSDGIDNDANGRTDCAEFRCAGFGGCDPGETTVATCSDGIDNDQDGFGDCADFDCSDPLPANPEFDALLALCTVEPSPNGGDEDTAQECSDGIDNDGNGFIDCDDFGCSRPVNVPASTAEALLEVCPREDTFELCTDGIDNDGNGFVDCADFGCSDAQDIETQRACGESIVEQIDPNTGLPRNLEQLREALRDACSNGIDEDFDDFIDCDDWDCSHNIYDPDFCDGPKVCR